MVYHLGYAMRSGAGSDCINKVPVFSTSDKYNKKDQRLMKAMVLLLI